MAFDNSGIYSRFNIANGEGGWTGHAAAGIKIEAGRHDAHDQDIANALSLCIMRDGHSTIKADIPWSNRRITNLADPTQAQDAATRAYVDKGVPGWEQSKYLHGTDGNGRLNFTGPTGVNGITWTTADMSWVGKAAVANQTSKRLVATNTTAASQPSPTVDVMTISELGHLNISGRYTHNLSYSSSGSPFGFVTITPGFGEAMQLGSGAVYFQTNSDVTVTDNYRAWVERTFFSASGAYGHSQIFLDKDGTNKVATIYSRNGGAGQYRWVMALGDGATEIATTTDRSGSNFSLYGYDNDGNNAKLAFSVNRASGITTFGDDILVTGQVSSSTGHFTTSLGALVISAADGAVATGTVYIRPDGPLATAGQTMFLTGGDVSMSGDSLEVTGALFKISTKVAGTLYLRPNGSASVVGEVKLESSGNLTVKGDIIGTDQVMTGNITAGSLTTKSAFVINGHATTGDTSFYQYKTASGDQSATLYYTGTEPRWQWQYSTVAAETGGSGSYVGSDFALYRYDNQGLLPLAQMSITRATGLTTFYYDVTVKGTLKLDGALDGGALSADGTITVNGVTASSGDASLNLKKTASGDSCVINAYTGSELRWQMIMGTSTAETDGAGNYTGSNFYLNRFDNAGGSGTTVLNITRSSGLATFGYDVTVGGQLNVDSIVQSTDTSMILAAANGGSLKFRPNGAGSPTEEVQIDTSGNLVMTLASGLQCSIYGGYGYRMKAGSATLAYGGNGVFNASFTDNVGAYLWVNITAFLVSGVSDYRGKQDMAPLPSMWDRIKALRPISYKPIGADDRRERWGFVAHELQETLTETAATGKKDGADRQALDMASTMTLLAALTGGLREAMTRIEALEAAA